MGSDPASQPLSGGTEGLVGSLVFSLRKMRGRLIPLRLDRRYHRRMRRLRIEALIPESASDAPTRVHQLLTREGWVLRHVEVENIDWVEGLDILRETLETEPKDEIKNDYSPLAS